MRIHAEAIFKRNIQFILFVVMVLLSVFTIIMNIRAISKANRPMIIGIDANGTRIVTEVNDPIFKTEAVSFVQKFLFNIYNFNSDNFMKRIGLTTALMSDELWKKKKSEILDLKQRVEKDEVVISSEIRKITLDEVGNYHALVLVNEKNRMNEQFHKVAVTLKLKQIQRTVDNPYGVEVDSYEEAIIRD